MSRGLAHTVACLALLALLSVSQAQGSFGVRFSPALTTAGPALDSVSAFVEYRGVGVFAQVRPETSWEVTIYRPLNRFDLDLGFVSLLIQAQPGATIRRESGRTIYGLSADVIIGGEWHGGALERHQ